MLLSPAQWLCVLASFMCVGVCVCLRGMLVHTHVLVHILVADTGYGKAQLYPSDFGDVVHQLSFDLIPHRLPVCVSLSFIFSVSVFVLCENQSESHAVLPTGHSKGYGLQHLKSSCND